MVNHRFSVRQLLLLLGFGLVAFLLRTWWQWHWVFAAGQINLAAGDAQYHARLIENLVHHFPWRNTVDPFLAAGSGIWVPVAPLLDTLVATVAWIIGAGSPSAQTIDIVTALASPTLALLTVLAVGWLGLRLFGAVTGLVAAALLAIMPGQFLWHSLLGDPNHHVLEALLSALTVLTLVTALQHSTPKGRLWRSILAGAVLGAYMLAWSGAALLVFILCVWVALFYVLHDLRGEQVDTKVAACALRVLLVALICVLVCYDRSFWRFGSQLGALLASMAAVVGLEALRRLIHKRSARKGLLTLAIIALAVVIAAVFFMAAPDVSRGVLIDLGRFDPSGAARSVSEIRPLLIQSGPFSLSDPLLTYGAALPLGVIGVAIWIVRACRHPAPDTLLFTVWSAVLVIAMFCQNRFGYYAALPMALLTAWLCVYAWQSVVRWRRDGAGTKPATEMKAPGKAQSLLRPWMIELTVLALVFLPSLILALPIAKVDNGVSPEWRDTLAWLRDDTPQPFVKPDYFLDRYRREDAEQPQYTVMNWWDYGYDIIRGARRVPVSNPTQTNASIAASFFVSTSEPLAEKVLDATRSKYVVVTRSLMQHRAGPAGSEGLFRAMAAWANVDRRRYMAMYMRRDKSGTPHSVPVYLPDYYRSMAVRLYLYKGKAAAPENATFVFRYVDRFAKDGSAYREIVDMHRFATYNDALDYMHAAEDSKHLVLGGLDPLKTAVPLDAITHMELVYSPPGRYPFARVFEYTAFK